MSGFTESQVADRLAIQDLIATYADLIDGQRFDELDAIFTDDAVIDFSTFNGPVANLAEIKEFLGNSLPFFTRTQHMMGLPHITIDGDTAHARTSCSNPMISTGRDGTVSVWLIGLWYVDTLARTAEGWRFSSRVQERSYTLTGLTDSPMGA